MDVIFNRNNEDLSNWKTEMHIYEKGKRTKKPFGKSLPAIERVTYSAIKSKETNFNPVLQTFKYREDEDQHNKCQEISRVKSLFNHYVKSKLFRKILTNMKKIMTL